MSLERSFSRICSATLDRWFVCAANTASLDGVAVTAARVGRSESSGVLWSIDDRPRKRLCVLPIRIEGISTEGGGVDSIGSSREGYRAWKLAVRVRPRADAPSRDTSFEGSSGRRIGHRCTLRKKP